jgi:hypothetical protein
MPSDDTQVEELLSRRLSQALDGQTGRAEAFFHHRLHRQAAARRLLIASCVIGAVAAAVAVVVFFRGLAPRTDAPTAPLAMRPPATATLPAAPPPLRYARTVSWRTDEPQIVSMGPDRQVRMARRRVLETVRWYDPQRDAYIELNVPRQQVVWMPVEKY